MNPYTAFHWGKAGPRLNPIGAQVVYIDKPWDVVGVEYADTPPIGWRLALRSFDRTVQVRAPVSACSVLERIYGEEE